MWPGHRALRYYLTRASTGNEDLGERCLHRTGICSQQYRSFYGSESRFAIRIIVSRKSAIKNLASQISRVITQDLLQY